MPGPTIHQLLGLPSDVTKPHAYQVFGLDVGESDEAVIESAMKTRIAHLKRSKPTADPAVWAKAASVVQSAKTVLADPDAKAELDARFGIVAPAEPSAVVDPLADLLPPATPVAAESIPAEPTPVTPTSQVPVSPPSLPAPVVPVVSPRRVTRRRRSWGGLVFGSAMLLGLFAIVGTLAYFVFFGPGQLRIVQGNGQLTIQTGDRPDGADRPQVAPPRELDTAVPDEPVAAPQSGDAIMKTPEAIQPGPSPYSLGEEALGEGSMVDVSNPMVRPDSDDSVAPVAPPEDSAPETMVDPMAPVGGSDSSMVPNATVPPPTVPEPVASPEPTAEQLRAGTAAIDLARQTLVDANWETMKPVAEAAQNAAATPDQVQLAQTIYETADLATYYRGAVSRAMANLQAGNEFKLTPTLDVIVVEASADSIQVRRGERIKAYPLDDLPLVVADSLAPMELQAGAPTTIAARAVFQAISPKGTPEHRTEAIKILSDLTDVEGADPKQIAKWIATLPPR